jgi:hypothetical protein
MAAAGQFMLASLPIVNVITPVSRPQNLRAIYANLVNRNELNIRWFTIFEPRCAAAAEQWAFSLHERFSKLSRPGIPVEVAVAGTNGGWGGSKRSYAMSVIHDGWCYFLDDDNLMHRNFPGVFRQGLTERPDAQVIVFHQVRGNETMRLRAAPESMGVCHFDTGQFVIKRSFIGGVEYAPTESRCSTIWPDVVAGDWEFIKKFWRIEPGQFHFVPEVGAYYNAMRD